MREEARYIVLAEKGTLKKINRDDLVSGFTTEKEAEDLCRERVESDLYADAYYVAKLIIRFRKTTQITKTILK